MESIPVDEKTVIVLPRVTESAPARNYQQSPATRKTQRNTLILLAIELFVLLSYFVLQIIVIVYYETQSDTVHISTIMELLLTLGSIGYLAAFILILALWFPSSIFTFTCLTTLQLIRGFLLFVLAIMSLVNSLSSITTNGVWIILDLLLITIGIAIITLSILIILCLFKLMRLLKL